MINYEIHGEKGGQSKPHTPVETPNNLLSVAYAKILMAVAEGELAGNPTAQDIFLDGTPLGNADGSLNFEGVKWEWRSGTQHQTYIQGMPEVSTEFNIGVTLRDNVTWTRLITTPGLDAARVTFQFPAMYKQETNGDTNGTTVEFAIDIAIGGGAFTEAGRYTITGKTNQAYEKTYRVDLPASDVGWTIRARRITPESTSSSMQNSIVVKSYTEVKDLKQTYPHTALLYVEFDSRTFGGGSIPKLSVRTRGRIIQVPSTYDPESRTYSGVWSGDFKWAWTNNPVWVYYDLVTQDRFALGHKITPDMVDKWSLYELAQYCDVMVDKGDGSGDKVPRHTCNVYLQEQQDAYQVLRDIASIFNGITYWDGTKMVARADKKEDLTNAPIFSRANVVNGRFDYPAADMKSINTSALISFDDPDNHYESAVAATWERSQMLRWGGDRQISMSAIGCTSRSEAQRRGKYVLLTNMYNRMVKFRTGLQGLDQAVLPGNVIHVVDPLMGGRPFTGRAVAATTTQVTLDRESSAKVGDTLYITMNNGITEGREVSKVAGKVITLRLPYSKQPPVNSVWYLESSDLKSQLFRVTKVTNPDNGVFEIEGVEYNESKFDAIDNGARLESRPINQVPDNIQAPPASVNITSRTYVEQTMAVTTMTISWDQTPGAVSYDVQWRVGDGDWVNAGITGANSLDIKGIYAGEYLARVRARNSIGIGSVWTTSTLTNLAGKEGTPPTLASFTCTPMFFGIRQDWTFPSGATDTLKTEIVYSQNPSFASAIKLGDFSYPLDYNEMHGLKAGQRFWFWTRLVDKTGNIGPWYPASDQPGIDGVSMINDNGQYNDYLAEMISETMLDKSLYERIELIDGPPSMPGSVNARLETVNDRIDETNNNLNNAIADLEDQIANITDALVYDPTKTYVTGDIVRVGNKLYQAQQNVPINTTPPNVAYWKDVGTILEDANAVVNQVNVNTQKIEEVDGKVVATANQITGLQAMWRDDNGEGDLQDALSGWDSAAKYGVEVKVRASEDEALAQRITSLSAEVGDNKASITSLEKVVATNNTATAERLNTIQSAVESNSSTISTLEKTVTDLDSTTASSLQLVNSKIDNEIADREASVGSEATTRAEADSALGIRIDTTEASIDENKASIQQVESAQATLTETVANLSSNISSVYTANRTDDEGSLQDALGNWTTKATYGLEVKTRADENEAMTQRVETLRADFQTAEGTLTAGLQNEATVRATADTAMASQITVLRADVNGNIAAIKNEETVRTTADEALGQRINTVQVSVGDNASAIQSEVTARTNADNALGQRIDTVQATAGNNSAAIQTLTSAQATTDGKVNASWQVKMELNSQGQYVAAGIGLGIENGPAGLQSQFLVRADRFAVVNGINGTTSAPFVVTGGQVFINDALINQATITNAIIGSTLRSQTMATWAGLPATMMVFSGEGALVMRNPSRANTYVTHTPQASTWVIDGVTRVRIGSW